MKVLIRCPKCQLPIHRDDGELGVQRKCPHCGHLFIFKPEPSVFQGSVRAIYAARAGTSSLLEDFIAFRTMITPALIVYVFWLGTAIFMLMGLFIALGVAYTDTPYRGLVGTIVMFGGPFIFRIVCEQAIVFFRINETLTEILKKVKSEA